MTLTDLTARRNVSDEAKNQPAHAYGWKEGSCNTDSSAMAFLVFLKDIVFLGMIKQDSLKSVIR